MAINTVRRSDQAQDLLRGPVPFISFFNSSSSFFWSGCHANAVGGVVKVLCPFLEFVHENGGSYLRGLLKMLIRPKRPRSMFTFFTATGEKGWP